MQFNLDPDKQANEIMFSRKSKVHSYPPLTFNNNDVKKCIHEKHLGIILDLNLDFNIHVDNKILKSYKIIGIIKRLSASVQRRPLLTIYTNPLSDHIWTMEISYIINQKI